MAGFGAKVKLTVDKSNKADFNNQINSMINQIKISNKFVVLQKDMDAVSKAIESALDKNPIKVNKIDCSGAVADMRKQLQSMIDSLSIKNGVTISGIKDPTGTGVLGTGTVKTYQEAADAVNKYNEQLQRLKVTQQSLDTVFKSATAGKGMLQNKEDLAGIQTEYDKLIGRISQFKTASEAERESIIATMRALQEKITTLQQAESADRKAAAEAEKARKREADAAANATANLKQYYSIQTQINQAINNWTKAKNGVTSGQYAELSNLSTALTNLFATSNGGKNDPVTFNAELQKIALRFAELSGQIRSAGENAKSFSDRFGTLGQKFATWLSASQIIMLVVRSIKKMITAVKELDAALTQIQIVTGVSDKGLSKFADTAAEIAKRIGASVTDVIKSTETFARLGYSLDQSAVLSEVTGKYANVAATTIDEATSSLTSIMKAFNVAPEEMEDVVSMLVKVGQEYAVSASELGLALQNGGAALEAGGNSLEQSIALIAAGNAAVQDASIVGNALKTTSMRIRSSTAELEEMGETVDDLVKSASKYRAEIKALSGVDIMLDETTYKSTYQILKEIAAAWKNINDIQRSTLLEDLAGKRNANVVKSIITNLQDLEGAYDAASNAAGTLATANDTYMESIGAKISQFRAQFQEFSSTLFDSSLIKGVVDIGTALFSVMTQLEKIHVLLPLIVASITLIKGASIAKVAASVRPISLELIKQKVATEELAASVSLLDLAQKKQLKTQILAAVSTGDLSKEQAAAILTALGLAGAEETLNVATKGLAFSFKELMASIPIFGWIALGISAIIELIPLISSGVENASKTTAERLNDLNAEFDEIKNSIKTTSDEFRSLKRSADEVIPKFAELSEGVDAFGNNISLAQSDYETYIELNNQIAEMFPEINVGMDSNGNAMLALSGNADTLAKSLYELVEAQRLAANTKIAESMPDVVGNISNTDTQLNKQIDTLKKQRDAVTDIYNSLDSLQNGRKKSDTLLDDKLLGILGIGVKKTPVMTRTNSGLPVYDVSYDIDIDKVTRNYKNYINGIEREIEDINNKIIANHRKVNPVVAAWMQTDVSFQELGTVMQQAALSMVNGIDFHSLGLKTEDAIMDYVGENVIDVLHDASPEVQDAFSDLFSVTSDTGNLPIGEYFSKISDSVRKIAYGTKKDIQQIMTGTGVDTLISKYSKAQQDLIKMLNMGAVEGYEKTSILTPDEIQRAYDIVKNYGIKTWDDLITALENRTYDINLNYSDEVESLNNLSTAIKESVDETGLSAESIDNLTKRYADLAQFEPDKLFEKTANGIHLNVQELAALEDAYSKGNSNAVKTQLSDLIEQYDKLSEEIDNCADETERYKLISQRDSLGDKIKETATLAAQYEGLASAYHKWVLAKSNGNERDMYEEIITGVDNIQEAMSRGWLGDDEKAFIQLLSSADLATASVQEYLDAYNELKKEIGSTGFTVFDFFTKDQNGKSTSEGVFNFFEAVRKELGETYAWIDEHGGYHFDFGIGGDQDVAERLGISVEAVQTILRAAADAGFKINLDSLLSQLDLTQTAAEKAVAKLRELEEFKDIKFNFSSTSIDDLNNQIESARRILYDDDGKIRVDLDEDSIENAKLVLASLIQQKQALAAQNTVVMHVKVDDGGAQNDADAVVKKLQELQQEYNNKELAIALNIDSGDSQKRIEEIIEELSNLPDDVKAQLGLDIPANIDLDDEAINTVIEQIHDIDAEMLIAIGVDPEQIDGYVPPEKEGTVKLEVDDTAVKEYQVPQKEGVVKYTAKINDWVVPTRYGTVEYKAKMVDEYAKNDKEKGKARAGGSTGEHTNGVALGGELGPEILVRDGSFYVIGAKGAEFFQYRKGDIIFNAEQSKQLMQTGKIRFGDRRGQAFSDGDGVKISDSIGSNGNPTVTVDVNVKPEIDEDKLKEIKDALTEELGDLEHDIFMKEKNGVSYAEIVRIYKNIQVRLHEVADQFREMGLDENDDYIQELQKQWWDYADKIKDILQSAYDAQKQDREHTIFLMEKNGASTSGMISEYRSMQQEAHALTEEYLRMGLDENDDLIQELQKDWWDFEDSIKDLKEQAVQDLLDIVDAANQIVDTMQNVNDVLHDAANKYAANGGFISVDTFQKIVELGPQYLQYLKDENDQLIINDERINDVIKAKTRQLALETAMSYVERLRLAANGESLENLNELIYGTTQATDATWGLVYAQLALVKFQNDEQYQAALHNIDALYALAENAVYGIGKVANSAKDALDDMKSGLDDILKYTMEMLKQRINDQIEALREMKDAYKEIISLRKESLRAAKNEQSYQDKIAEKVKQLADLQKRINALSRDDSRDAAAERIKAEEDMAKIQKELADEQADHAVDAQEDALDDMEKAYSEEKDKEIKILQDSISSYQKLYDMAISYINDHWDTLYSELIDWNYKYGNDLSSTISTAWENCLAAAQRYGSFVSALGSIDADIAAANAEMHNDTVSPSTKSAEAKSSEYSPKVYKVQTEGVNRGKAPPGLNVGDYVVTGGGLYQVTGNTNGYTSRLAVPWVVEDEAIDSLVSKYKDLIETRGYRYHTGGIAGNKSTLKQNEILAKLENGEMILDQQKQKAAYQIIDFTSILSGKLGRLIRQVDLSSLFNVMRTDLTGAQSKTLGAVTNNSQKETIHFGDVYITGADDETVRKHQEVNRKFTNDILKIVGIKR